MNIGIFGSGSWGTALAMVLVDQGHQVYLWSNDRQEAEKIRKTRRLVHKLPEIVVPSEIVVTEDDSLFIENAELFVVAVPSRFIRSFAQQLAPRIKGYPKIVVSATKGIEAQSLSTMSEVLEEHWRDCPIAGIVALSGPSHAEEVARKMPTTVVSAYHDEKLAKKVQDVFQTPRFRVYTNEDRKGVEIGAAFKNIIAIAVGISDGLGFGDNARAGLISRGLYEISLVGKQMGASPETFSGLSGLGDLVVTCTSRHSRNRRFGELIAKGYGPEDAEEEIGMVVEGLTSVQAIPTLNEKYNIEIPISEEVYSIVYQGANPQQAVERLMLRERKSERSLI